MREGGRELNNNHESTKPTIKKGIRTLEPLPWHPFTLFFPFVVLPVSLKYFRSATIRRATLLGVPLVSHLDNCFLPVWRESGFHFVHIHCIPMAEQLDRRQQLAAALKAQGGSRRTSISKVRYIEPIHFILTDHLYSSNKGSVMNR